MKRSELNSFAEQIAGTLGLGWYCPPDDPQNPRDNPDILRRDGYGFWMRAGHWIDRYPETGKYIDWRDETVLTVNFYCYWPKDS